MENKTNTRVVLRCFGCGAVIQNTNPALTGFLPRQISSETPLCQRCYRLQHYGEDVPNPNFSRIIWIFEFLSVITDKNKCSNRIF